MRQEGSSSESVAGFLCESVAIFEIVNGFGGAGGREAEYVLKGGEMR